jgi:hypothetical protein
MNYVLAIELDPFLKTLSNPLATRRILELLLRHVSDRSA